MSNLQKPDYVFESSWEVCNKVGGIYTVLSTRAKILTEYLGQDRLVFIGPDFWRDKDNPLFEESHDTTYESWLPQANADNLQVRIGYWNIPGKPIAILVNFQPFFAKKDEIYRKLWEDFKVDSLHAYGDYDEASMFSYAAGKVVESLSKYLSMYSKPSMVYHGNEWMTGLGLLYVKKYVPEVATIFTTHATSIGRSIAGNGKPLYEYLWAYNGDQMAWELNMESKQSIEKQTAWNVDCFTTVSNITAKECKELLDKDVDVVLPNGFNDDFLPKTQEEYNAKRQTARKRMLEVANQKLGTSLDDSTIIISTSGRYEFRNKGYDVFLESMRHLAWSGGADKSVLAFIFVPYFDACQQEVYDCFGSKVCILPIPYYLDGNDGVINLPYYDVILGNDICLYPSYYEPWGYTPLEAIAFGIPCITSNLAGFGVWAEEQCPAFGNYNTEGVHVMKRTDYNFGEVSGEITEAIKRFSKLQESDIALIKKNAIDLSKKALWSNFIEYYKQAYSFALNKNKN